MCKKGHIIYLIPLNPAILQNKILKKIPFLITVWSI